MCKVIFRVLKHFKSSSKANKKGLVYCQAQGPTQGPTQGQGQGQGQGQDMVRSWLGHGQVRSGQVKL